MAQRLLTWSASTQSPFTCLTGGGPNIASIGFSNTSGNGYRRIMHKPNAQQNSEMTTYDHSEDDWLIGLNKVLDLTDRTSRQGLKTNLSCRLADNRASLFLPPDMAQLQPETLAYLHALGAAHDITLVEDRRKISLSPTVDKRNTRPSDLAIGVSLLLKQTGLPGPAHSLSAPHVLREHNHTIELPRLIAMAAKLHPKSKKVIFLPNRFLTGNFTEQASPMTGYACKSSCDRQNITLSYFTAPEFRSVGYITGDQFVLHVLLAGGSIRDPKIWSSWDTMTNASFRCQVFRSPVPGHNFGVLYSTFYIDLESSMENQDWWEGNQPSLSATS